MTPLNVPVASERVMNRHQKLETVLFLGQLPPPWHGQASINATLSAADFSAFQLRTHAMAASRNIDEVGRPSATKVVRLIGEWVRLASTIARHSRAAVVYSLGAIGRSALYRDAVLLGTLRLLRQRVLLHVHADLDQLIAHWKPPEQLLARTLYHCSGIIRLTAGIGQLDRLQFAYEAVLPSGIEDTEFVRPPERPLSKPAKVVFVGNLYEAKGILTLLEACRSLAASETPIQVDFIGATVGGRDLRYWIREAERLRISDRVSFRGLVPSGDVARSLADADIFCLPSENEAMPIVIIEAMRAGLPVVSTRVGAIPHLVDHGVTGLLVQPRDARSTAEALAQIISDQGKHAAMCRRAREKYCCNYTQSAFVAAFERIVNEFLEQGRRAAQ